MFHLSLPPVILYHLYSSLLNRTPTNFCHIFPLFLFVFHLSLSPLILYHLNYPFSIASLLMSCTSSIVPLFLFVFRLSLSPLILYHLYSSLLNHIPTYFFQHMSFVSFPASFVSVSSHSLSCLLIPSQSHPYKFL